MNAPPPPPPPHNNNNNNGNRNGLPDGPYDIFVVPPHSSGGGFIYFPSLQTHRNSFIAGSVCTLFLEMLWFIVFPAVREWVSTIAAGGGLSMVVLLLVVGAAGWVFGKTQMENSGSSSGGTGAGPQPQSQNHANTGPSPGASTGATPGTGPGFGPGFGSGFGPGFGPGFSSGFNPGFTPQPEPRPPPTWQRSTGGAANASASAGAAKGGWEKAREETRKKEEERKKAEDLRKKREDDEKERVKQREKDAREREARERREKEAAARAARPTSPNKHRHPTAKTATDDGSSYSYRPYDDVKRPSHKPASASSIYSESSYAPSHSTSRTTPPPSHRGPYRSKDPDKIVIKAVYSFNNAFTKTPIAKLVSGMGSVTDGLILRVTTEGLFIDDDVRGVPQREWDVKAWTLKLVEVWCPHLLEMGASSGSNPASRTANSGIFGKKWSARWPSEVESESVLESLKHACKPRLSRISSRSDSGFTSQSGEFKGLHVLRASIRDAEGKKYVVVLQEEEGWKVAVGLQRLRRGSQVRALGVSGMPINETRAILENMGFV